ncbi:MAG: FkbM family methyltransferase [Steroidobacteraceae bacterium]
MNYIHKIIIDTGGIAKRCGWLVSLRWLRNIALTLPECLKARNLQPADVRMGSGPFPVNRAGARAQLIGPQVFSGLREIWVRDVYLKNDYLAIPRGSTVVDLGANLGNFTILALAQHDDVRVVAVEPSVALSDNLREAVSKNGWSHRVAVKRAFVGIATRVQSSDAENPDYRAAPFISEQEFLEEFGIRKIDFLKCDIEGSEFFLLDPNSKLLSITTNLAIEIHAWGGSVPGFLEHLLKVGFEIGSVESDRGGSCIALCKRPASKISATSHIDEGARTAFA